VVDFYQWLLDNGHKTGENHYAIFRRKNARLFKNTYQTSKPKISFEDAAKLINQLPESVHRNLALQILGSGERYSEAIQRGGTEVVGKGSKRRATFRPQFAESDRTGSYATFRRTLASIGLKPHDLRKLLATRLVERGMNEADLMEVMGWSSILTAKAYLQPKKAEKLKMVFQSIHEELK
jgi:site-specific recombinase XerD